MTSRHLSSSLGHWAGLTRICWSELCGTYGLVWAVHFGDDDSGRVGRTSKSAGSGKLFWAAASWPGRAYFGWLARASWIRLLGLGFRNRNDWLG